MLLVQFGLFTLLGYAGVAKLIAPEPATAYLHSLIYIQAPGAVTLLGAVEVVAALWLLTGLWTQFAAGFASFLFTTFAVSHFLASPTSGADPATCGCLGQTGLAAELPSSAWILLNAGCALAAGSLLLNRRVASENA